MRAVALLCLLASVAHAGTYEIQPSDDLFARLAMLEAGDEVIVHAGTYDTPGFFDVTWTGTEAAPIVVRAAPGARPVIAGTPAQNVINLSGSYFTLRGFELRGGSHGIRLGSTDHATLEDLVIHDVGDVGISCNRPTTICSFLTIRRNEIYNTGTAGAGAAGEGMYLGCNEADCVILDSLIEGNYVHDLGGEQGDGIEIKTGASNVVVRDNVIVRAKYPGITMYGYAGGRPPNIVERNLVWTTEDNGIQIVGQVRVRNNIVIGAGANGIHSKASQGFAPIDVEIVNNTVLGAAGACLKSNDWAGTGAGRGQLVVNNALYCGGGTAIDFNGGAPNASVVANVGLGGSNAAAGFVAGRGLEDLVDAAALNVYPAAMSPLENGGVGSTAPATDFDGCPRRGALSEIGAYERGPAGAPIWPLAEAFKPVANCGETGPPDGAPTTGDNTAPPVDGGCCSTARGAATSSLGLAGLVALALLRRRRAARR